ncbi:MAG: hypothetical protein JWM44_3919 [Bacilli bacterium]|jgi:putative oxidoreductase|nr:hypothetical protein [Bacilli bacterium]
MHILSVVLQIILGLGIIMSGLMKFNSKQQIAGFKRYGFSPAFRMFTGFVEVLEAIGLIAGIWNEKLAAYAALALAVTMFFAMLTHLVKVKDPFAKGVPSIIFLVLSVIVVIINWS